MLGLHAVQVMSFVGGARRHDRIVGLADSAGRTLLSAMRVWIDQDLCTGDGLCVDHCPDVFVQLEDGIAYVHAAGAPGNDPGSSGSLVVVPDRRHGQVVAAADDCPGECIFIELDDADLEVA